MFIAIFSILSACWKLGIELEPPIAPQECEPIEWFGEAPEKLRQYDCLYANHGFTHVGKESLKLVSGEVHYRYPHEKIEQFERNFLALQRFGETEEELQTMALQGYFMGMVLREENHDDGLHAMLHDHGEKEGTERDELEIQFHFPEEDGLFVCEPSNLFYAGLGGDAGEFLDPIINGLIGYHEYGYTNVDKHPEARSPLDHKQAGYHSHCRYTIWNDIIYPQELYISMRVNRDGARYLLSWLRENSNVLVAGEEQEALHIPNKIDGWPDFGQYQYSSVIKFGEQDSNACTRKSVIGWAKTDALDYGISDPQKAVNYRSWACQMGISEIQTMGFYSKGMLYLHRRYVLPF